MEPRSWDILVGRTCHVRRARFRPRRTWQVRPTRHPQINPTRQQVPEERKRVLLFRDPRHRLHIDRVHGEDQARQQRDRVGAITRPGDLRRGCRGDVSKQPPHHQHQQRRARGVEQHVHQMIEERIDAEEPVLHPEKRMQERIVLLGGAELGPDADQTVERLECRLRDVVRVVPNKVIPQRRQVHEHRGEKRDGRGRQPTPADRKRRGGNGRHARPFSVSPGGAAPRRNAAPRRTPGPASGSAAGPGPRAPRCSPGADAGVPRKPPGPPRPGRPAGARRRA